MTESRPTSASPSHVGRADFPNQVWALLGERRAAVALLVITSVAAALIEASILAAVAQAAAALVSGSHAVHATLGPVHVRIGLGILLGVVAGLAAVRLVLQVPLSIIPSRIGAEVQMGMQRDLFAAFTHASWSEQAKTREGHLQELVMNQALQATWGAMSATGVIIALLTLVVFVASALVLNVVAALVVIATVLLLFVGLRPFNAMITRRARALSQAQMDMASGVGQAARLAEETRVFDVGAAQRRIVAALAGTERDLFFQTQLLVRLTPGMYQSFIYLLVIGGLSLLYVTRSGHVSALGAVVLLLIRAGSYGQQLQSAYQTLRQNLPFVERIRAVEKRFDDSAPLSGKRSLSRVHSLSLEQVSFAYEKGRPVLTDISFAVEHGETIGIVGPSGAGKSTLVQILLRLRDPDSGRYLINRVSAHDFAATDWYSRVAYVPQEPRLLHATVADNIRFHRPLDTEAVRHAARQARIEDDILGWAHGYDTIIGPRADAVSGGQQQRICIARALAGRPEVLVLDEPTSALDPHSESLLQESLLAVRERLTLFIIAHRMSTLGICNRVIVLVNGQLEAFDTPAGLTRRSSYYRTATALSGDRT